MISYNNPPVQPNDAVIDFLNSYGLLSNLDELLKTGDFCFETLNRDVREMTDDFISFTHELQNIKG